MAQKVEADDLRVQWLAKKVCLSLGCDVASFTKLMANTPTTYEFKETIEKYLAGACSHVTPRPTCDTGPFQIKANAQIRLDRVDVESARV